MSQSTYQQLSMRSHCVYGNCRNGLSHNIPCHAGCRFNMMPDDPIKDADDAAVVAVQDASGHNRSDAELIIRGLQRHGWKLIRDVAASTSDAEVEAAAEAPDDSLSDAIAEVAQWWSGHTGCFYEEAWDDLWDVIEHMREVGISVELGTAAKAGAALETARDVREKEHG